MQKRKEHDKYDLIHFLPRNRIVSSTTRKNMESTKNKNLHRGQK